MSKEKLGIFSSNGGQTKEEQEEKKKPNKGLVYTNPGCALAPVYKRVHDEKLDANVVKQVDDFNIFEFVQASKSTTDLATLQKRFIELGEIPNANPDIQYGVDTTIMPHNIHELYRMANDVEGNFKKLPESVQKVFGDSQSYLNALLDGTYNSKLVEAFKPKEKAKDEPAPSPAPAPEGGN